MSHEFGKTMVDLHCHILPNVDDGATSLEEALAMARFYVADGVSHVFATPHCHRYIRLLRADVLPRVALLNKELKSAKIPVTVLPGSEIQVTDTALYRREFEAGIYCHLGDGRSFTLLEFNWARAQFPPDAIDLLRWIRSQGMTVILAHPERHDYFWKDPSLLKALVDTGAWVQVTVDSLLGNHGPVPKTAGETILRSYPNAVLSSDSHNMKRCSGLSAGFEWVRANFGEARCDDLRARADQVLMSVLPMKEPAVV